MVLPVVVAIQDIPFLSINKQMDYEAAEKAE